jgi:hypothetical protein
MPIDIFSVTILNIINHIKHAFIESLNGINIAFQDHTLLQVIQSLRDSIYRPA